MSILICLFKLNFKVFEKKVYRILEFPRLVVLGVNRVFNLPIKLWKGKATFRQTFVNLVLL